MIPAPRLLVVMENVTAGAAHGGVPRHAIASRIANDQDRCRFLVRSPIRLGSLINSLDLRVPGLRIDKRSEPRRDLIAQSLGFLARFDDPLIELAAQIQENARQTDGKRFGLRPIDPRKVVLASPRVVHNQVTVLLEPAIEVDAATKGVESMIR